MNERGVTLWYAVEYVWAILSTDAQLDKSIQEDVYNPNKAEEILIDLSFMCGKYLGKFVTMMPQSY